MAQTYRSAPLSLLLAVACAAQTTRDLQRWMDAIAQQQLDARESVINGIHTTAEAEKRKRYVRSKILELLGGLPDYDGPLNARVTGQIREPGFVLEKIIFESLPHVYVTANLYRPEKAGKYPGVLLPLGHWDYGKGAVQRIAGNLALKGFVVLTYDPFGQGERFQIYDRRYEGSLAGWSTEQHLLAGAQCLLIGQSFARYRIWDAKRALDYLTSRPEVNADRIGCTGCSGGGTVTTYISALDPRIKVAAPACYINSFRQLFTGPLGDSEQSLPGFVVSGLDIADYIELFAPKPWLISSTREDFFPLAGARAAFQEARKWYGTYDAQDKVKWVVGPGGHGTPLVIREAIYDWMIRWLRDGDGSATEQEVPRLPDHELFATATGQVADLPQSREVFDVIRDDRKSRARPGTHEELIEALRKLVAPPQSAPKVSGDGAEIAFETEPGLELGATLIAGKHAGRAPAVLVVESNKQDSARALELANQGNVVLLLAPRGAPPRQTSQYSGDWIPNVQALLIGRNLPAMRAHDILAGVRILAARDDVDPAQIRAEASGVAGVWLLMAAALDPSIAAVSVSNTPYSLQAPFESPLTRNLHAAVIPGFALHWDLADLVEPESRHLDRSRGLAGTRRAA